MRHVTKLVAATMVILGLGLPVAHAETVISVTQISYNYANQPVCTVQRMNPAIYGALPSDPCTLGTEGSYGPDRITKNIYDAAGQMTEVQQALGTPVARAYARYSYNANGTKAYEIDAKNNMTLFVYDGFDRLNTMNYPCPSTTYCASPTDYEQFGYDANGNRTSWRRRDGNTINYTYDNINREIIKDMPGGSSTDIYTNYDGLGHITWKRFASTSGFGVSYAYDSLGRVSSTTDMNGRAVSYGYNADSARYGMWYPDAQLQLYYYDNAGEMYWTGSYGGAVAWGGYFDNFGRIIAITHSNSTSTWFGYDAIGRLASMTQDLTSSPNDITWSFTARNPAGQITQWNASSAVYDYKEIASSTVNKTYDGLNRDAGIAALSGGYDARGNMTFDGVRTFTYDLENRLLTDSAPGVSLSLEYDPEGRLSKYTSSGSVTTFLYDGVNLIGEYDGAGNMTKRYMHTLGTDQPWVQFNGSAVTLGNAEYLYANYQGSIIAMADGGGTVTDMYKYGPYGEPKNGSNVESWTGSRFRYTGQIMLPDARLYYYKARVYDPIAGRFLQTDPVGSKDDLDLYAYVAGDPVNKTDPSGNGPEIAACLAAGPGAPVCAGIDLVATGAVILCAATDCVRRIGDWIMHNDPVEEPSTGDAPEANNGDGPKHGGDKHNDAVDNDIKDMKDKGYKDIRKNQTQVDANGNKVGNNRPDAQGTRPDGTREYREQDTRRKNSEQHGDKIRTNDPNGICILGIIGDC